MTDEIKTLKEDIAVLQEKLNKLEEIEKRNAVPRMNLETEGKFDMVSYNNDIFYRLEYPTAILWYKRKGNMLIDTVLKLITDLETHRLLEGVWYNDVQVKREKKGFQPTSQTPEEVEEGLRAAMRQAKEEGVFDNVVDEVESDINENENKPRTLFEKIRELGYSVDCVYEIVDAIKEWLPQEYIRAMGAKLK